jgi:hypothetical protein
MAGWSPVKKATEIIVSFFKQERMSSVIPLFLSPYEFAEKPP